MASLEGLLDLAGVRVDGRRPWDIVVHDRRLERRVRRGGVVALGDAYVDGWWDCDSIDQLHDRLLRAGAPHHLRWTPAAVRWRAREFLTNPQNRRRVRRDVRRHYNLGADLFQATLDSRMVYSCGYWRGGAADLESAQAAKLDLVCRKAGLEPGMRVLDIGCGWGALCRRAAERYGCEVIGVTLSEDQRDIAADRCAGRQVEIRLQDYRDVRDQFDRIVSVGMFEHVGAKNHRAFMRSAARCLDPTGLMVLHFFATQRSWPNRSNTEALWVEKRIFPGMAVPSLAQVGRACEGLFVLEDVENFGVDYDPTLCAWHENFASNYEGIRDRYPPPFDRLWRHYLLSCAGAFRSRKYQVWQMVLSPAGVPGGYRRPETPQPAEDAITAAAER